MFFKTSTFNPVLLILQMLAGLPDELQKELFLNLAPTWAIASTSDCNETDRMLFASTLQSLEELELGESTIKNLWRLLAAILHMGNLDFFRDGTEWHTTALGHLEASAHLLGVKQVKLWKLLTTRTLLAGSNVVVQTCSSSSECGTRRDTFLKLLYRTIFDWVLHSVNKKLQKPQSFKRECRYLCKFWH
jgi:myosin heavy subunit